MQVDVTLPQVFFKHFANKNQQPGLSVRGTLVENGLMSKQNDLKYNILNYLSSI